MEQSRQVGDWKCQKLLGRGSFGSVGLWKNLKTGDHAGKIFFVSIGFNSI